MRETGRRRLVSPATRLAGSKGGLRAARVCDTPNVRLSDFWRLMDDEFGAAYARSLARDHVLAALGNRTPLQALESGIMPREAWLALCVDMDVPVEHRLGKELRDPGKKG